MKRRIQAVFVTVIGIMASLAFGAVPAHADTVGRYIIVFNDSTDVRSIIPDVTSSYGLKIGEVYEDALKGMAAQIPKSRLTALQRDRRVKYVEEDRLVTIDAAADPQSTPTGIQRIFADSNPKIGINGSDDYRVDVDVAVIDTGVDLQHPDLNVKTGVNCTTSRYRATCVSGGDDDHFHGTHVAGIIGALDNGSGVVGVAPGARIWPVKVLDSAGSGYSSWIVAGINWVAANASTIEVANMSLGGEGYSRSEYDAIQGAVNKGVAFAVAAGNEDDDANNYSPGGFDNVLSTSALADFDGEPGGLGSSTCRTDQDDTLADFSNWGPEVDIAAPGVCILSTYPIEQGSYGTISGTSMASPHVAGALALLASTTNPANATDVNNLYNQIRNNGNYNWTDDSGDGRKEPLLDVSNQSVFAPKLLATGASNVAPTANFTSSVSGLTATFTDTSSDTDGTIASRSWNFGDGGSSTVQNPSHSYGAAGTYTVSLTVTDNDGATASVTKSVTVTDPTASITLTVTKRTSGWYTTYADLKWTGATGTNVDIYRNNSKLTTTANDGAYSDTISSIRRGTTISYKVCLTGTTTCSPVVTVVR